MATINHMFSRTGRIILKPGASIIAGWSKRLNGLFYFENTTQKGKIWR